MLKKEEDTTYEYHVGQLIQWNLQAFKHNEQSQYKDRVGMILERRKNLEAEGELYTVYWIYSKTISEYNLGPWSNICPL